MIKIAGLGHVLLKTANIEASIKFFRDLLGFELVEFQSQGHEKMAFLSLGYKGHDIDLVEVSASALADPERSRIQHIAFQVGSYAALQDAYFLLSDNGIEIIRAVDHISQKSIYFKDPDGNIIELYHEIDNAIDLFRKGRGDNDAPLFFVRPVA